MVWSVNDTAHCTPGTGASGSSEVLVWYHVPMPLHGNGKSSGAVSAIERSNIVVHASEQNEPIDSRLLAPLSSLLLGVFRKSQWIE